MIINCRQYQTKSISLLGQTDYQHFFLRNTWFEWKTPELDSVIFIFCNSSIMMVKVKRAGVCDITTPYHVHFLNIKWMLAIDYQDQSKTIWNIYWYHRVLSKIGRILSAYKKFEVAEFQKYWMNRLYYTR